MKAYKIDLSYFEGGAVRASKSRQIQEKAFRLGYSWMPRNQSVMCVDLPYLFLDSDGSITCSDWKGTFEAARYTEIYVSDFLRLPESGTDKMTLQEFDDRLRELLAEIGKSGYQIDYVTMNWLDTRYDGDSCYLLHDLQYMVKS